MVSGHLELPNKVTTSFIIKKGLKMDSLNKYLSQTKGEVAGVAPFTYER